MVKVKLFNDSRITILNQCNQVVSTARNRGISYANEKKAEHIFLLDADDYWLPEHIATHLKLKKQFPQAEFFGSNYRLVKNQMIPETRFSNLDDRSGNILIKDFFDKNNLDAILKSSSVSF